MIKILEGWGIKLTVDSLWGALAGGVGAFVGYFAASIIVGSLFDQSLNSVGSFSRLLLGQAALMMVSGLVICAAVLVVDNHQSLRGRWDRDLLKGLPLFAGLSFLSGGLGQLIYSTVGGTRAIPWMFLGAGVGISIGLLRHDKTQVLHGAFGGAIGGIIGGLLVDVFLLVSFTDRAFALATMIGLIITGAMIGLLIRVVQDSLKKAWILGVSPGRYEGKTYPLNPNQVTVGKSELNDISLYLASELEMQNGAFIFDSGTWEWQGDAAEINGIPQTKTLLNPGDVIRLGGTQFRFEMRSTASEITTANAPQTAAPPTIQTSPPIARSVPPPSNASNHSIWILEGASGKIQLPTLPTQVRLGRSDQNQITINDPSVSSRHAIINMKSNALTVIDLNSTNGTYINGNRIPPRSATVLHENDQLILGQQAYVVRLV